LVLPLVRFLRQIKQGNEFKEEKGQELLKELVMWKSCFAMLHERIWLNNVLGNYEILVCVEKGRLKII
jgi:hypothetical protein